MDLTFIAERDVTLDEVNAVMKEASEGAMKGVLGYNDEPLVSIDFNHSEESAIFAADQTKVTGKRLVRVLGWYDNEWGFSTRMADLAVKMGSL